MAGQTDLDEMLASLTVVRRPGVFTVVVVAEPVTLDDDVQALLTEDEGVTAVVEVEAARRRRAWRDDLAFLSLSLSERARFLDFLG